MMVNMVFMLLSRDPGLTRLISGGELINTLLGSVPLMCPAEATTGGPEVSDVSGHFYCYTEMKAEKNKIIETLIINIKVFVYLIKGQIIKHYVL